MKKYYLLTLLTLTSLFVFSYAVWLIIDQEALQFKNISNQSPRLGNSNPKIKNSSNEIAVKNEKPEYSIVIPKVSKSLPPKVYTVSSIKYNEPLFKYQYIFKKDSFTSKASQNFNFVKDVLPREKEIPVLAEDFHSTVLSSF